MILRNIVAAGFNTKIIPLNTFRNTKSNNLLDFYLKFYQIYVLAKAVRIMIKQKRAKARSY